MDLHFLKASCRFRAIFFLLAYIFLFASLADAKPKDKSRWNSKYSTEKYLFGKEPIPFLKTNFLLLPKGKTLDVAMGEGRNGVFLASKGHDVTENPAQGYGGSAKLIVVDPDTGVRTGGSDPRSDGHAAAV